MEGYLISEKAGWVGDNSVDLRHCKSTRKLFMAASFGILLQPSKLTHILAVSLLLLLLLLLLVA